MTFGRRRCDKGKSISRSKKKSKADECLFGILIINPIFALR
jgi:hypothetical protein